MDFSIDFICTMSNIKMRKHEDNVEIWSKFLLHLRVECLSFIRDHLFVTYLNLHAVFVCLLPFIDVIFYQRINKNGDIKITQSIFDFVHAITVWFPYSDSIQLSLCYENVKYWNARFLHDLKKCRRGQFTNHSVAFAKGISWMIF